MTLEGLDDLLQAFDELIDVTSGDDLKDVVQIGGDILLKGAQRRVRVDTGELHDSLKVVVSVEAGRAEALLETDNDHAAANEFGTAHMPAQSFLRATVDDDGDKVVDAMAQALGRKIERVGR